jgi:hypothetical protein
MDDVNSSFGRLSTKASEWKPTSSASSSSLTGSSDAQSDLKATAVKEFVPGRAWTAGGGGGVAAHGEIHASLVAKSDALESDMYSAAFLIHLIIVLLFVP